MKTTLKVLITVLLFSFLLWYVDVNQMYSALKQVDPVVIIEAIICIIIGQSFAGLRWALLCKGLGIDRIDIRKKMKINYLASFLGNALPFYGGSDIFRAYMVASSRTNSGWNAAASILASRANGFCVSLFICFILGLFLNIGITLKAISFSVIFIVFILVYNYKWIERKLPKRLHGWRNIPFRNPEFRNAWYTGFLFSILIQVFFVSARCLVGWNMGVDLTWLQFSFLTATMIAISPFVMTFGYFGAGMVLSVSMAVSLGADLNAATALAIVYTPVFMLSTIPGLFVFMGNEGRTSIKRFRELPSKANIAFSGFSTQR